MHAMHRAATKMSNNARQILKNVFFILNNTIKQFYKKYECNQLNQSVSKLTAGNFQGF